MEIFQLEKEIRKHNKLYYEGKPKITDAEYDALVDELKYLDFDNEVLKEVGAPVSFGKKVNHNIPMGSLEKIKCQLDEKGEPVDGHGSNELENWIKSIDCEVCFSHKVDGLAGELIYKNGKLVQASSRGNGSVGQDLTDNVLHIESIPIILDDEYKNDEIVLRGEFYIPKTMFKKLLSDGLIKGDVVNERNVCSGAIMSKNPLDTASKGIRFMVYKLFLNGRESPDIIEAMNFVNSIKGNHFSNTQIKLEYVKQIPCDDYKKTASLVELFRNERESVDFRTDGIVVIIKNSERRESFGYVGNNPKGAIAFKYQTEQAVTRLLGIDWITSKYGTINPVAKLSPVVLCDTVVKAATLHNINWIESLSLSIGDDVVIEKSGDIIPHVVRAIHNKATNYINYPDWCPTCGSKTVRDGARILCLNMNCRAVVAGTILNYLQSLDVLDIGRATVEKLIEAKLVSCIADLYKLTKENLLSLPRFSDKLAENFLCKIESTKTVSVDKFVKALPIRDVGEATWQDVCYVFPTLDDIMTANWDQLMAIPNIGPETARAIVQGISECAGMIYELKKIINITPFKKAIGKLKGICFCFSGKLSKPRTYYEELVIKNGGQVKDICKAVNYLVVGESPGSKLAKANRLEVKVIKEEAFLSMI